MPVDPDVVTYPSRYAGLPRPLHLPFTLKPLSSADTGIERLPDGRTKYWIRHEPVRGVTPSMLVWWFANLEGEITFRGQRYNRYRFWHPRDHYHASYARRRSDGTVGPGAAIRLIEILGRNERFSVDTVTHIERLDEGGYVHNPELLGRTGFVRMEYRFEPSASGTLYENSLTIGAAAPWYKPVRPLVERFAFTEDQGRAWLLHNIEEVGMFEHFLPALHHLETGDVA